MKTILNEALKELIACIEDAGMEYPEAHWYVIDRFDLTVAQGEALTNLYDECGGILE